MGHTTQDGEGLRGYKDARKATDFGNKRIPFLDNRIDNESKYADAVSKYLFPDMRAFLLENAEEWARRYTLELELLKDEALSEGKDIELITRHLNEVRNCL